MGIAIDQGALDGVDDQCSICFRSTQLGIGRYYWQRQADGLCNAWAGLSLRPRDMAKIGQLMIDHGCDGEQRGQKSPGAEPCVKSAQRGFARPASALFGAWIARQLA